MSNRVVHFEVIGQDAKRLQDFYGGVFSWNVNADNPMNYGMVSAPDDGAIGGGIGAGDDEARGVTFYIEVANLDETLRQVEKAGGRTVMAPADVPGGPRMAKLADPEGNVIGLVQADTMRGANQN